MAYHIEFTKTTRIFSDGRLVLPFVETPFSTLTREKEFIHVPYHAQAVGEILFKLYEGKKDIPGASRVFKEVEDLECHYFLLNYGVCDQLITGLTHKHPVFGDLSIYDSEHNDLIAGLTSIRDEVTEGYVYLISFGL